MILTAHGYVSIELPDPEYSDRIANQVSITSQYTMTGQLHTHKKTNDRYKLFYTFSMPREQSSALMAFLMAYLSTELVINDHLGYAWKGYIITNPLPLETVSGEFGTVSFEVEGCEL